MALVACLLLAVSASSATTGNTAATPQQQETSLQANASKALGPANMRMAFLTDCTPYSAWQSVAMAFAFKQHHQPAGAEITRIMCCTEEEKRALTPTLQDVLPTHIAKSFTWSEDLKDWYQVCSIFRPGQQAALLPSLFKQGKSHALLTCFAPCAGLQQARCSVRLARSSHA